MHSSQFLHALGMSVLLLLHPLELVKSEIDVQECPGDSLERSLVGSVCIIGGWGWGVVPP